MFWPLPDNNLWSTSASELLAALIWVQPLDGPHLAATITAYRNAGRGTMETAAPGDLTRREPLGRLRSGLK
jgi:hypothetical protein